VTSLGKTEEIQKGGKEGLVRKAVGDGKNGIVMGIGGITENLGRDMARCIETCDPSLRSDQAKQPFVPIR